MLKITVRKNDVINRYGFLSICLPKIDISIFNLACEMSIKPWKSVLARPCSGKTSKRSALAVRATKNICAGKGYHTKAATAQIHQMEPFCALLIPRFYIIYFETKTNQQLCTQIHCQKSHTFALVCQGLWRHIRTNICFLVDKHDEGIYDLYISKEEIAGNVLPFRPSQ